MIDILYGNERLAVLVPKDIPEDWDREENKTALAIGAFAWWAVSGISKWSDNGFASPRTVLMRAVGLPPDVKFRCYPDSSASPSRFLQAGRSLGRALTENASVTYGELAVKLQDDSRVWWLPDIEATSEFNCAIAGALAHLSTEVSWYYLMDTIHALYEVEWSITNDNLELVRRLKEDDSVNGVMFLTGLMLGQFDIGSVPVHRTVYQTSLVLKCMMLEKLLDRTSITQIIPVKELEEMGWRVYPNKLMYSQDIDPEEYDGATSFVRVENVENSLTLLDLSDESRYGTSVGAVVLTRNDLSEFGFRVRERKHVIDAFESEFVGSFEAIPSGPNVYDGTLHICRGDDDPMDGFFSDARSELIKVSAGLTTLTGLPVRDMDDQERIEAGFLEG